MAKPVAAELSCQVGRDSGGTKEAAECGEALGSAEPAGTFSARGSLVIIHTPSQATARPNGMPKGARRARNPRKPPTTSAIQIADGKT
jgi:hypothetical protein